MSFLPPKLTTSLSTTYDAAFFEQHKVHRKTYEHFAALIREHSPHSASSILDVGCGHCLLLEALQMHFASVRGIDGSDAGVPSHLRSKVAIEDISLSSWRGDSFKRCDIVVSLETAEHLPEVSARSFVAGLLSGVPQLVFFSAATPFQDGGQNPTHSNEQPLSYWVQLFEGHGYPLASCTTMTMRAQMFSSGLYLAMPWYPKNLLVFGRDPSAVSELIPQQRLLSSNPVVQMLLDRDRLEFENIILRQLKR